MKGAEKSSQLINLLIEEINMENVKVKRQLSLSIKMFIGLVLGASAGFIATPRNPMNKQYQKIFLR